MSCSSTRGKSCERSSHSRSTVLSSLKTVYQLWSPSISTTSKSSIEGRAFRLSSLWKTRQSPYSLCHFETSYPGAGPMTCNVAPVCLQNFSNFAVLTPWSEPTSTIILGCTASRTGSITVPQKRCMYSYLVRIFIEVTRLPSPQPDRNIQHARVPKPVRTARDRDGRVVLILPDA